MKLEKIIGMVHLDALPGYPQHASIGEVTEHALHDIRQLEIGGVDSALIENTYDDPVQKVMENEQIVAFSIVAQRIRENTRLPLGICCLFNDYRSALAVAKIVGAQYVRIPVFTEAVMSDTGYMEGNPKDVISYRNKIGADDIKILADVQVKHSYPLARRRIQLSARGAINCKADELVITGEETGHPPSLEELKAVRDALPKSYINIGSGTTPENINILAEYANAVIVGTFFYVNGRVDASRVKELRKAIRSL